MVLVDKTRRIESCVFGSRVFREVWVADFTWLGHAFFLRVGSRILPSTHIYSKGSEGAMFNGVT